MFYYFFSAVTLQPQKWLPPLPSEYIIKKFVKDSDNIRLKKPTTAKNIDTEEYSSCSKKLISKLNGGR